MKFYKNLYVGDTIKKPEKIKRKLRQHKKMTNVFVILYAVKQRQLEICNSLFLQQWYYKENPPFVIGLAGSRTEAFEMIGRIAEESIAKTGKADLAGYLFPEG